MPVFHFELFSAGNLFLSVWLLSSDGFMLQKIQSLILDNGNVRICVDTCIGNDKQRSTPGWSNLQTDFLDRMKRAGYEPESITHVICTHVSGFFRPQCTSFFSVLSHEPPVPLHFTAPRRPRRLEHAARERPMDTHFPKRPLRPRQKRIRALDIYRLTLVRRRKHYGG